MSFAEFALMCIFTVIGIKYLLDMVKYAKGYEINGKCRYGRKYARELAQNKNIKAGQRQQKRAMKGSDLALHDDVTELIAQLSLN